MDYLIATIFFIFINLKNEENIGQIFSLCLSYNTISGSLIYGLEMSLGIFMSKYIGK